MRHGSVSAVVTGTVGVAVLAAACAGSPTLCSLGIEPAIRVTVVDSASGVVIAGLARGAVHDGAFVDSLRPGGADGQGTVTELVAADERPGTYRVDVVAPGYRSWSRTGVRVPEGSCHVQTAELTARLQAE